MLKDKAFPVRSGIRRRCSLLPLLFNIVLDVLARWSGQEKEIKGIQVGKEEVKSSLFTDDIILYVENPDSAKKTKKPKNKQKLIELINTFSKVAGYKINTQKSVTFQYNKN